MDPLAKKVAARFIKEARLPGNLYGGLNLESLITDLNKVLVLIEKGNIYDNLKLIASSMEELSRIEPPIDADVVRKGHDIARRVHVIERGFLDVMIDVSNMAVALETEQRDGFRQAGIKKN